MSKKFIGGIALAALVLAGAYSIMIGASPRTANHDVILSPDVMEHMEHRLGGCPEGPPCPPTPAQPAGTGSEPGTCGGDIPCPKPE